MSAHLSRAAYAFLTIALLAVITVLELYPFRFRVKNGSLGPARKLLSTWAQSPQPLDFFLNIVAYVPFGFCATLSLTVPNSALGRVLVVVLCGTVLSISFELAQYYIPGRFTSAADVYANTLGTLVGSAIAVLLIECSPRIW